jgi:hypothetical protein
MIPQPVGSFNPASGQWRAMQDWTCELSRGDRLIVREGFESDGASIPRVLWPVVGPRYAAKTFAAALAHDAMYAGELVDRKRADDEFRRLLVLCGVGYIKSTAYWAAVRAFGWLVWRDHTTTDIRHARLFCEVVTRESYVALRAAD